MTHVPLVGTSLDENGFRELAAIANAGIVKICDLFLKGE
jgi:hypothetical protein